MGKWVSIMTKTVRSKLAQLKWAATHSGPAIDDASDLYKFWAQEQPAGNDPEAYIRPTGRSQALLELVSDLPKGARILEVGCNVGRNLAYLHDHGYVVEGVEISQHAVNLLRKTYPQLADSQIHIGPAEHVLPRIADESFDLVFTMAVIEHIHPNSSVVFDRMSRIARQVLAIEPSWGSTSHRQFPHKVRRLFTVRGMTPISETSMASLAGTADDAAIRDYTAFRFAR